MICQYPCCMSFWTRVITAFQFKVQLHCKNTFRKCSEWWRQPLGWVPYCLTAAARTQLSTTYTTPRYLVILLEVGYHDDGGAVKLPYHAPEIRESGGDGTLGGDVGIGMVISLEGEMESQRVCVSTGLRTSRFPEFQGRFWLFYCLCRYNTARQWCLSQES